ncbi:hypothetical protein STHAL_24825 [Streptomyces halstedii]|uniref:Uncharacterized protein n=1 Tax=Streptomyces halstedii TaxID=1944 RepID=A0ABS6TWN8_STRHA|nr:hypothetical protein [Streptomyces halstedii]MBV7672676.1 hypothetical protein [Streptomyces halstedii]
MTRPVASAVPLSSAMTDEAYGNLRAAAALWAGASVLITNEAHEVLVQEVDYRSTRLLPGGGVDRASHRPQQPPARPCRSPANS